MFVVPAVLQHGRLPGGLGAHQRAAAAGPPRSTAARLPTMVAMVTASDSSICGLCAGRRCGRFRGPARRPTPLPGPSGPDEPGVDEDVAPGHGEGVEGGIIYYVKAVFVGVGRQDWTLSCGPGGLYRRKRRDRWRWGRHSGVPGKTLPRSVVPFRCSGCQITGGGRGGAPCKACYQEPGHPPPPDKVFHKGAPGIRGEAAPEAG